MTISKLAPKLTSQLFTRAILALILSFGLWGTSIQDSRKLSMRITKDLTQSHEALS